jgi:hypothetical protein
MFSAKTLLGLDFLSAVFKHMHLFLHYECAYIEQKSHKSRSYKNLQPDLHHKLHQLILFRGLIDSPFFMQYFVHQAFNIYIHCLFCERDKWEKFPPE